MRRGRKILSAGSGLLMVAAAACSSVAAPRAMAFTCRVEGEELLNPPATAAAVCERIRSRLEEALGTSFIAVDTPADGADWLRVEVRFARPGTASARITRAQGGAVSAYPDRNVAVWDRPLDLEAVERLAGDLAEQLQPDAARS